jgi:hypothetical protein
MNAFSKEMYLRVKKKENVAENRKIYKCTENRILPRTRKCSVKLRSMNIGSQSSVLPQKRKCYVKLGSLPSGSQGSVLPQKRKCYGKLRSLPSGSQGSGHHVRETKGKKLGGSLKITARPKERSRMEIVLSQLVAKPKTIKQRLNNRTILDDLNEGHEDDYFERKRLQWKGRLLSSSSSETSLDELEDSDDGRSKSPLHRPWCS